MSLNSTKIKISDKKDEKDEKVVYLSFAEMKHLLDYKTDITYILKHWHWHWQTPTQQEEFGELKKKKKNKKNSNRYSDTTMFMVVVTETLELLIRKDKGKIDVHLHLDEQDCFVLSEQEIGNVLILNEMIIDCMEEFGFCNKCLKRFSKHETKCGCAA